MSSINQQAAVGQIGEGFVPSSVVQYDSIDSTELEFQGFCQKKNSKGFFQNRYFETDGSTLQYWPDVENKRRGEQPSASFDVKDITSIERHGHRTILLRFSSTKFVVEIKAASEEQSILLQEILQAKRSLYCVSELLFNLDSGTKFQTKTFEALMKLQERDQSQWIVSRLNECFVSHADEMTTSMRRSCPSTLISAARSSIEEFNNMCVDCEAELSCRDPVLTAHCRHFIHRYATILQGRLVMELAFIQGHRGLLDIGEKALCEAIVMVNGIEALRKFKFLHHDFINVLICSLFSVGELMSALLDLSIERIDAWFKVVSSLPAAQRAARLLSLNHVLLDAFTKIDFEECQSHLHRDLLLKVSTNMLLNFSDQLLALDISEYDEESLLAHLTACHKIAQEFPQIIQISVGSKNCFVVGMISSSGGSFQKSPRGERDSRDDQLVGAVVPLLLPSAIVESVEATCLVSARTAVLQAVENIKYAVGDLCHMLLEEKKSSGWLGGAACRAYIDRLSQWLQQFTVEIPSIYSALVREETAKLCVRLYLKNLARRYQHDKRMRLSRHGVHQFDDDLRCIHEWMVSLPQPCAEEEKALVAFIRGWIEARPESILQQFSTALRCFGIQFGLHIYDILRLVLKMRVDFSANSRRAALGMCAEFHSQLQVAIVADSGLMSGEIKQQQRKRNTSIFEEICPLVGIEHITGKHWSLETISTGQISARIQISQLITEVCSVSRSRRLEVARMAKSISESVSVDGSKVVSPVDGCKEVSPVNGCKEVSPVNGCKEFSAVDGCKDVSPVEDSKDVSPVDGCKEVSPVEDSKEVSPVEDSKEVSPVEDSKEISSVEKCDEVSSVEKSNDFSPSNCIEKFEEFSPVEKTGDAPPPSILPVEYRSKSSEYSHAPSAAALPPAKPPKPLKPPKPTKPHQTLVDSSSISVEQKSACDH